MPFPNVDREEKVYRLWRLRTTIEQMSLQLGIPRSTVGYYARKFERSGRQRLVPQLVAPSTSESSTLELVLTKVLFTQRVMELLRSGDYANLYYFVQTYRMLMQMQSHLVLTKEEKDQFQGATNVIVGQTEEGISSKPELIKKKKITELLGLD